MNSSQKRIYGVYTKSQASRPSANITRPDNTTAYTAGDVVGTNPATGIEFSNIMPENGQHFYIVGARLIYNENAVPANMSSFTLHLFSSAPTAIADNTAWTLLTADKDKYLGSIEIDTPDDLGDVLASFKDNLNIKRQLNASSTTIYGQLVTNGAYTPAAESVLDISLEIVGA